MTPAQITKSRSPKPRRYHFAGVAMPPSETLWPEEPIRSSLPFYRCPGIMKSYRTDVTLREETAKRAR